MRAAETLRRLPSWILVRDGILLIPLAALVASLPRIRGVSCGDDFPFHLISWLEIQRAWSQGVLYPHWAQSPNWNAGEPRFIFYPPLSWILGALLGYLLPWSWVETPYIFLSLTAAGLATRAFARAFLPPANATLAGVLAAVAPYSLFAAYHRGAFSELLASAWIPLLLLFAWRPPKLSEIPISPFPHARYLIPVSLLLAVIWLTNAPAGVMASYLLAFAALSAAILQKKWWPIWRAAFAAPLGLGLAAFYLVPAAREQRWVAVRQAVGAGMNVGDSWLFARHANPEMEWHDHVLLLASVLVVFTAALASAAFAACLARRKLSPSHRHIWLSLAFLIPAIVCLQLPISAPIWRTLPKVEFLQFPWRWLIVLGIPFAVFLAAATPLASRRSRLWAAVFWIPVVLCSTMTAALVFFQYCGEDSDPDSQVAALQSGAGVEGTDEYAAIGSDNSALASSLPDACLVSDPNQTLGESDSGSAPVWYAEQGSCDDTYKADPSQTEYKRFQLDTDHDGFVILRLTRYPAWQIAINGEPAPSQGNRADGLIAIPIREGASTIEIRWTATPDVLWGRGLSAISLAILSLLWLIPVLARKRRASALRLSS